MNDSGGESGPFPRPPALDLTARVEGADPIDIEVKLAVVLGSDAVKSLVRRHAARAAELGAALDRAERTIENGCTASATRSAGSATSLPKNDNG